MTETTPPEPIAPGAQLHPFRRALGWWFGVALWRRILGALVLGAIAGVAWGPGATSIAWIGELFVRLIRMLVVPLVFLTIAAGVAALADPKRLGSIGVKTLAMYVFTTTLAVTTGLIVATLIGPGIGASFADAVPRAMGTPPDTARMFMEIIPDNPVGAMADGKTLSVIFFAILVGAGVIAAGKGAEPVRAFLNGASDVMLKIVGFVMETAPFGVFALIAVVMGTSGPASFLAILKLAICVVAGSAVVTLLIHGLIVVRLMAWLSPLPFFRGIADAIMVGFSTSSSSATLPVAIRVAQNNLGISKPVASTVLPLGATIGMDGAAMYVAMLTLFSAQAFGLDLTWADYLVIAATTTIVAMGVAPVPSGSLFVLAAVLHAIGITPEQTALVVGFVLPFDRILDMTRTVPNVTSDLAIATAVARWEGEMDVTVYNSANDV
ncbi:dicarboxylate/amino acid:cation symporter [Sphingomonas koreensis]|jgi:Na+/H+-dicarboxylate symporter|uniref:Dicarboxylate/amino acid:cation symporter n=1 Tax=Sphingomonas koreensis TaxID=93064 RepID=A0A1L6JEN2_9SPHN|nr:dicarboxylate/amino acid:cation symporter [Sphingomonas koreensis]APR54348.1 dicarboxylate/amino acid:cation symporter [Sphingomonas koreensis]MDC7809372.1 dicarboxylate/amino acid:cation symporter [Sphingomonas koreensis]PJI90028.1 Na+/H+-dicarboxylate symporter [Sphingomonas koreensis]RSU18443.1 dicarboxylate/amino acid:cation symporter [Sphingomonas koreensis]RSU22506.1 dicarboxylate/amino acid:cation symporter [Sphingomonas koreensis]